MKQRDINYFFPILLACTLFFLGACSDDQEQDAAAGHDAQTIQERMADQATAAIKAPLDAARQAADQAGEHAQQVEESQAH